MKVWPIDPLVPRNLRLEVPEKLTCVALKGRMDLVRQSPLFRERGWRHRQTAGKALELGLPQPRPKGRASTGLTTLGMVTTSEIGLSAAKSCQMDAVHRLNGDGSPKRPKI